MGTGMPRRGRIAVRLHCVVREACEEPEADYEATTVRPELPSVASPLRSLNPQQTGRGTAPTLPSSVHGHAGPRGLLGGEDGKHGFTDPVL